MEANDGRTLTMVTICYQLLGRLLERSVIGPELSRNDQKAPSLQEGEKKKKSTANQRKDVKSWSRGIRSPGNTKESRSARGRIKMTWVLEKKTIKDTNNKRKSSCFYQNKAIKCVILLIRIKRSEGQESWEAVRKEENWLQFFGLYFSYSWQAHMEANPVSVSSSVSTQGFNCGVWGLSFIYFEVPSYNKTYIKAKTLAVVVIICTKVNILDIKLFKILLSKCSRQRGSDISLWVT